jgi:TetR/AcrR family transcriptional regulator, transcriptional repressor for nem operon
MTRSRSTRDRIVRAAARLFLARSYQAVGVNEICTAAEVQKGSFYHFFPSKSDLAIAVIDHHAAALWDLLDTFESSSRGPANKVRATADVVGDIQGRLHGYFGRVVGCPLGNLAVELVAIDDAAGKHAAAALNKWERRVAGHCHDAYEVSQLRPEVDPDELAHQILAAMQGAILLAKVSDSAPDQIPKAMYQVIEGALQQKVAA